MNIADKLRNARKNLILLKYCQKLTKDACKLPEYIWLKDAYEEVEDLNDPIQKAIISIINSILFQRRVAFCLTRDSVRELIRNDKNWKKSPGLDNNSWSSILKQMYDAPILKQLRPGYKRIPGVYQVVDPDILNLLKVNVEEQTAEAIEFAINSQKADHISDHNSDNNSDHISDVELRTKNEDGERRTDFFEKDKKTTGPSTKNDINAAYPDISPLLSKLSNHLALSLLNAQILSNGDRVTLRPNIHLIQALPKPYYEVSLSVRDFTPEVIDNLNKSIIEDVSSYVKNFKDRVYDSSDQTTVAATVNTALSFVSAYGPVIPISIFTEIVNERFSDGTAIANNLKKVFTGQLYARWRKLESSHKTKQAKAERLAEKIKSISDVTTNSKAEEQVVFNNLRELLINYDSKSV